MADHRAVCPTGLGPTALPHLSGVGLPLELRLSRRLRAWK